MNRLHLAVAAASFFIAAATAGDANAQTGAAGSSDDAAAPWTAPSGVYKLDKEHGYITFNYLHQGYSRPYLRWREWDATLNFDSENPEKSSVSVMIKAASIDSGVDRFDEHLNGETFFDTANYPEITFVSNGLVKTGETTGAMTGDLTIKGETKPVTLDVTLNKGDYSDFAKTYVLGFSASGAVLRSDFGVDAYTPVVSDEVVLIIEAEFRAAPAE